MNTINITDEELKDFYLYLKKDEMKLRKNLYILLNKLEKIMNEKYTILEIENLLKNG